MEEDLPQKKCDITYEQDIRLWVPPKRRRPAKVKYIRKMKVIE